MNAAQFTCICSAPSADIVLYLVDEVKLVHVPTQCCRICSLRGSKCYSMPQYATVSCTGDSQTSRIVHCLAPVDMFATEGAIIQLDSKCSFLHIILPCRYRNALEFKCVRSTLPTERSMFYIRLPSFVQKQFKCIAFEARSSRSALLNIALLQFPRALASRHAAAIAPFLVFIIFVAAEIVNYLASYQHVRYRSTIYLLLIGSVPSC